MDENYDEFGNYIGPDLDDDSGDDIEEFDDDVPFIRDEARGDAAEEDDPEANDNVDGT